MRYQEFTLSHRFRKLRYVPGMGAYVLQDPKKNLWVRDRIQLSSIARSGVAITSRSDGSNDLTASRDLAHRAIKNVITAHRANRVDERRRHSRSRGGIAIPRRNTPDPVKLGCCTASAPPQSRRSVRNLLEIDGSRRKFNRSRPLWRGNDGRRMHSRDRQPVDLRVVETAEPRNRDPGAGGARSIAVELVNTTLLLRWEEGPQLRMNSD
jgi:hypothetical protein